MPIYALGDWEPTIHPDAYIHPDAVVIGNVHIGALSSVWPGAVLRGDEDAGIHIGERTSIQDGSVLHTTALLGTVVGSGSVIGHIVHLEGCTIEDGALVGNGSVVLHEAIVRTGAVVGSNAVVPGRMEVPAGALALGVPAKLREGAADQEVIALAAQSYVDRSRVYRQHLRRLD
jgi:carbonic anhydrase/acetyltransferase-like protein (isoleucine patch superfamily)